LKFTLRSPLTHYSPEIITRRNLSGLSTVEPGFYLIKLYTHNHESLFGEVVHGCLVLNNLGNIAAEEWLRSTRAYSGLDVDQWLLLPNRIEALIGISKTEPMSHYGKQEAKPWLLSAFIASYKAAAAKRINLYRSQPGGAVWQRNYQERRIPDQAGLDQVRQLLKSLPGQELSTRQ
jgi:hypothetical protein